MALTANLTYSSESVNVDNSDIFTGVLTDSTTYGTPNADRVDVAVYLTLAKMKADTTEDYDIDLDSYNPESVTSWSFDIEEDGWVRGLFVIIPDYDNAASYVIYDVVYSGGVVYRAKGSTTGNPPPNGSYWEVITEPTSLIDNVNTATESANLVYQIKDIIIYPFTKKCFGDLTEEADCGCSDCERSERVLNYERAGVFVDQLDTANQRQKYANGERIARSAVEFCSNCQ